MIVQSPLVRMKVILDYLVWPRLRHSEHLK